MLKCPMGCENLAIVMSLSQCRRRVQRDGDGNDDRAEGADAVPQVVTNVHFAYV